MKTFIRVALVVAIISCLFIPVAAMDGSEIWAEETNDQDDSVAYEPTYVDHLLAFLQDHGSKIGIAALIIFETAGAIVTKLRNKSLKTNMEDLMANTTSVFASQSGVVDVVNVLIDGYNSLNAKYTAAQESEQNRDKVFAAVLLQNIAILDILDTVFVNLKNLPQGTKDIVNVRYAKCLSLVDDDEKLAECVSYIKKVLTEEEVKANGEDNTEEGINTEEVE